MRLARIVPLVSAALAVAACGVSIDLDGAAVRGSGHEVTVHRAVPAFERVAVGGDLRVEVRVGPARSVTLRGDDNLLPLVETEVRDGALHIRPTQKIRPRGEIRVDVTVPSLDGVDVGGSGTVSVHGVHASAFDASVSGSADMDVDGDFGVLRSSVSGSGSLVMRGTATEVAARVSGSGDLDLLGVPARAARVSVSGSGDVSVAPSERLDAEVSGSGDVRFSGRPRVQAHVSGSGSVRGV